MFCENWNRFCYNCSYPELFCVKKNERTCSSNLLRKQTCFFKSHLLWKYLTRSWIYFYCPLKPCCSKSRRRSTFPRPNKFFFPFFECWYCRYFVPYMAWHIITWKDNCYYLLMCVPSQLTNFCLLFNSNRCIKMAIVHDIAEGIYLNLLYFMLFFVSNVENCNLPRLISLRWRWID